MLSLWYLCLRLAEERQEAADQQLQPAAEDKRQKMLESLSKAGVENFNMKAAVPGTEIPGHKVTSSHHLLLPVLIRVRVRVVCVCVCSETKKVTSEVTAMANSNI